MIDINELKKEFAKESAVKDAPRAAISNAFKRGYVYKKGYSYDDKKKIYKHIGSQLQKFTEQYTNKRVSDDVHIGNI